MKRTTGLRLPLLGVGIVQFVLVVAVVALVFAIGPQAEEYTRGAIPRQMYRELRADGLLDDYHNVFAIAHNSGDTLVTTRKAIDHNADVIEIDVVSIGNRLYAGHRSPLPIIGPLLFQGPTLEEIWEEAATVEVIKLDLKESSPAFVAQVMRFLEDHPRREVVVVSRSPSVLDAFEEGAPHVVRVLSVPGVARLDAVLADPSLRSTLDGVSVAHSALTGARIAELRDEGLLVFAYTVNDLDRLNELVLAGVTAVTTDNLAVMELLGGPALGEEASLRDLRYPATIAAADR